MDGTYSGMAELRRRLDMAFGASFAGPGFMRRDVARADGEVVMHDPYMLFSFISWRSFNPVLERAVMFRDGAPYAYRFGHAGWGTFDGTEFDPPCKSPAGPATRRRPLSMAPFAWANDIGEIDGGMTPGDMARMLSEAAWLADDPDPAARMDAFWLSYFGRDEAMARRFVCDPDEDARILASSMTLFFDGGVPDSACEDPSPVVRSYALFSSPPDRVSRFLDDPDEGVQMYVLHSAGAQACHFMHLAERSEFESVRTAARIRLAAIE